MKKRTALYFLLLGMIAWLAPLQALAEGDILLQLRFYEGVRGPKPAEAKVVTTYTLRPLFIGNFITEKGMQEEEAELKRVFNLKDLSVLVQTQWGWEREKAEKRFQMVVLNGHEFLLQVVKLTAADAFQVQVIDQGMKEMSMLLDNEIVLPAGKVMVFGFEDSFSHPYFLAMQRQADAAVIQEADLQRVGAAKWDDFPVAKLLKKVDPVYPEKMLAAGQQGSVTLQIDVDKAGRVGNVQAFRSEEDEFVKAAVEAVRQWRIEPLVIDGEAKPQSFTCTFYFVKGGVALDFTRPAVPLNPGEETLYRRIRGLCEPLLGPKYKAEEISFAFKNLVPSNLVLFLAKIAKVPITLDPNVNSRITCDIPNMPWDQALARLMDMHGLDVASDGRNGLLIVNRFKAIWPTMGYVGTEAGKLPDGTFITSIFGKRLNHMTKKEDFHPGIDIAARKGTPVVSTAAGTVRASEFNDKDGNRIVIDHGNGYTTAYHHLNSREVKKDDAVTQGQLIGTVGSSGVSTGPHLHFEIRFKGEPRNPFDFIGPTVQ
jgi:TonB family protein